jgi:uncharacterized membrane protein YozB (DUF420 family)
MSPLLFAQQAPPAHLPGFLGTRGSLMLDVVFTAMFLIVPLLYLSIYLVKQRRYTLHKRLQLVMGVVLLLAVAAFEVDLQFFSPWRPLAAPSRFNWPGEWDPITVSLVVHLCFAIPTPLVWIYVIVQALRKFERVPSPGAHSHSHRRWGWIAAVLMTLTAVTGWVFYYLAFAASPAAS